MEIKKVCENIVNEAKVFYFEERGRILSTIATL